VSEAVFATLIDEAVPATMARVAGHDVYIPLGAAANLVLVQEADILEAARALLSRPAAVQPE
jgi:2-oxoisovalerate dehydrogenase E1 component